jgi:hypothetical protein
LEAFLELSITSPSAIALTNPCFVVISRTAQMCVCISIGVEVKVGEGCMRLLALVGVEREVEHVEAGQVKRGVGERGVRAAERHETAKRAARKECGMRRGGERDGSVHERRRDPPDGRARKERERGLHGGENEEDSADEEEDGGDKACCRTQRAGMCSRSSSGRTRGCIVR